MRRTRRLLLTTALVAAFALPLPAGSAETLPAVGGNTRIVAEGTAGIALRLPAEVSHTRDSYQATITDGTFAYLRMVPETCANLDLQGSCLSYRAILMPHSQVWEEEELLQFDSVPAGRLDVYVVTDGTVTLEMVFGELDGSADYVADAPVGAHFEELPRDCPDWAGDCANIGQGGATHTVGEAGGIATSIAYAETSQQLTGSIAVQSCVSPGPRSPAGSSDPADHPDGCQFGATAPGQDYLVNYAVRTQSRATGFLTIETNPRATGPVYAGYRAHHVNPLFPDGGFAGYGVWITLGIPAT